ncbi:MAG: hypothetical protein KQH83_01520 [Actinobacteria bacterium]|nr:hypothetical protein [Actinomycetota bacterium]
MLRRTSELRGAMPGRDEIREMILGAAEGATGSVAALGSAGIPAAVEDFDVEVVLGEEGRGLTAVVRFTVVTGAVGERSARSVA